jgi:hypothetical protein
MLSAASMSAMVCSHLGACTTATATAATVATVAAAAAQSLVYLFAKLFVLH